MAFDDRGQAYGIFKLNTPMDVEGELYRCVVAINWNTTDTLESALENGGMVALAGTEQDDPALLKRPLDFNNEVSYLVVGQIELAFEGL